MYYVSRVPSRKLSTIYVTIPDPESRESSVERRAEKPCRVQGVADRTDRFGPDQTGPKSFGPRSGPDARTGGPKHVRTQYMYVPHTPYNTPCR